MDFKDEKELIDKYLTGKASSTEISRLECWYNRYAQQLPDRPETEDYDYLKASADMWQLVQPKRVKKLFPYRRIAVAASIIAVLSIGGYFYWDSNKLPLVQQVKLQDIEPGGDKAMLTLSSGKKIVLNEAKAGQLAMEQQTEIRKSADGQLVYSGGVSTGNLKYNTMSTPRGGKYRLTLADGTVVTLDAASSITYPVAFNGKERRVKITGQVYFKVTHNATKPFRVDVKDQTIEDLGTEFNINAYDDEPIMKTTLLEGAARLINGKNSALLSPGEQAITRKGDEKIRVNNVDTEEATAWKNGYFLFNNEPLESVMRKVSRWYDVDIVYPTGIPVNESYLGSITRYGNVSKVLQMLEITGEVRFRVDGRKIFVIKKSSSDK